MEVENGCISNISFLSFRVSFHFHDYGRKCNHLNQTSIFGFNKCYSFCTFTRCTLSFFSWQLKDFHDFCSLKDNLWIIYEFMEHTKLFWQEVWAKWQAPLLLLDKTRSNQLWGFKHDTDNGILRSIYIYIWSFTTWTAISVDLSINKIHTFNGMVLWIIIITHPCLRCCATKTWRRNLAIWLVERSYVLGWFDPQDAVSKVKVHREQHILKD